MGKLIRQDVKFCTTVITRCANSGLHKRLLDFASYVVREWRMSFFHPFIHHALFNPVLDQTAAILTNLVFLQGCAVALPT